jgi:hypothetical protein
VLLAENRLSLPTENRITPLRVGLLVQFLLIVGWTLSYMNDAPPARSAAATALVMAGGIHLAVVAMFAVTEDLVLPRRVLLQMQRRPAWQRLFSMFLPGGGRGTVYILLQMALFVGAAWLLDSREAPVPYMLAICGYICFYTGVPAAILRAMRPSAAASLLVRVVVIVVQPIVMMLPDIVVYMWNPAAFDAGYSARHLLDATRTLSHWSLVNERYGLAIPLAIGLAGLFAYETLFYLGRRMTVLPVPIDSKRAEVPAGASRGADALS